MCQPSYTDFWSQQFCTNEHLYREGLCFDRAFDQAGLILYLAMPLFRFRCFSALLCLAMTASYRARNAGFLNYAVIRLQQIDKYAQEICFDEPLSSSCSYQGIQTIFCCLYITIRAKHRSRAFCECVLQRVVIRQYTALCAAEL